MSTFPRLLAIKIFASILLLSGCANSLPNDCALIATEAHQRLSTSAVWTRVIALKFIEIPKREIRGHMINVWQIDEDGPVLIYDSDGALILATHSRKLADIICALNELFNPHGIFIFEAKYL